ncbi:MAG: hypothetical protein Kow0092_17590 [Deferrisomatales bacterium]
MALRPVPAYLMAGAVAAGLFGCVAGGGQVRRPADPTVREVTVAVLRPPAVNLFDRAVQVVGVAPFSGPGGRDLSKKLAAQLAELGAFRTVPPEVLEERLLKTGLAVGWESSGSSLRWVHERTALDAVVVGRVETFQLQGVEEEKDTLTLEGTGRYEFVRTEEGKIAYRERFEYRSVPLYCRTDRGIVAASYRVWDVKRAEPVATVRHELSAEVPSFCYRGDVPDALKRQAQQRLLRRLFGRLNRRFLEEIAPHWERVQMAFEVLSGVADSALSHRNELGILYASRGEWRRAADMWADCVADAPDLPATHYNLALAYRAMGRVSAALEHLNRAISRAPRPLYLRERARVRALAGR